MKPTYTVTVEPEEISDVRGAFAYDTKEENEAAENAILERLERGDLEAWCCIKVTATVGDFEGVAYLGCCTLDNKYGPEDCAHEYGLKDEALEDLKSNLRRASMRGTKAKRILSALE
jgi:hypothetical protein